MYSKNLHAESYRNVFVSFIKAASIFSSVHIYRERYGGGGVYVCIKLHSFFTKKLLQHCTLKIQFIFICRFRRFQATVKNLPLLWIVGVDVLT